MKIWQKISYPLFSALLLFLATPNHFFLSGIPWIGFFALAPLFLVLQYSHKKAFLYALGYFFGLLVSLLQYSWLASFRAYAIWALLSPALAYGIYYFILIVTLAKYSRVSRITRPFYIAAIWTIFEFLKSIGYLGFPWGMLANLSSAMIPLIQIADITGMWGLSFLFALSNAVLAESLTCPHSSLSADTINPTYSNPILSIISLARQGLFLLLLYTIVLAYGWYRLTQPIPIREHISAVLPQPYQDPWKNIPLNNSIRLIQNLSQKGINTLGKPPDLLIWPETYLLMPYMDPSWEVYNQTPPEYPLSKFLKDHNTYLMVGTPIVENNKWYNAAVLINSEGKVITNIYKKQHLVPLGEILPWWDVPFMQNFYTNVVHISSTWYSGTVPDIFELPLKNGSILKIAPLICFEDSFADLTRTYIKKDVDILVNITNNAWSSEYSTLFQNLAAARFRSIESRRTFIRAGNSGMTQVIDPWGKILYEIPAMRTDVLAIKSIPVYVPIHETFYQYHGNFIIYILILTFLIAIVRDYFKQDFPKKAPKKALRRRYNRQ